MSDCQCFGSYSLLLGEKLMFLEHLEDCPYKRITATRVKIVKVPFSPKKLEQLPPILRLPQDVLEKIFKYVVFSKDFPYWITYTCTIPENHPSVKVLSRKGKDRKTFAGNGDVYDALAISLAQATATNSRKNYSTIDHYPPIYFLRLTCRRFCNSADVWNTKNKRFMMQGFKPKHPFLFWESWYNLSGTTKKNPYVGRDFIREDDRMYDSKIL